MRWVRRHARSRSPPATSPRPSAMRRCSCITPRAMAQTCGRRMVAASRACYSSSATGSTSACRCSTPPSENSATRGSCSTPPRFSPRWPKVSPPPGRAVQGLAVVDEALALSEKSEERWILAELLRLKGELLLLHDVPNDAALAENHFQQSLEWARRQGALA